jgi:hypothetical protein
LSASSSAAKALTLNINDATKMNANLIVFSPVQAKAKGCANRSPTMSKNVHNNQKNCNEILNTLVQDAG